MDRKVVTCATHYATCNPVSTAQRWSKSAKGQGDVPMPKPFEVYNKQMGGVDLFNQFVSTHCSQFTLTQRIGGGLSLHGW